MKVDDRTQRLLKELCDYYEAEDKFVRDRQIRQWKRLKYYWQGFQRLWYSEVAHDWRVFDRTQESGSAQDNAYYDKPINVFRAYLESIIAALSVTTPGIKCFPDDADNSLDLATAKAGDKISELISRHNNVTLLWLHALYIYCTEGLIACYSYPKEDESYGTVEIPKEEDQEEDQTYKVCPLCNAEQPDIELSGMEQDEFMPDDSDVLAHDLINSGEYVCPECLQQIDPEYRTRRIIVTRIIGTTKQPKTRICMEVYGGLYVKVPNYAMKQSDIPYLIFSYDTHYTNAIQRYEHLVEKYVGQNRISPGGSTGSTDPYEQWGRLSTQYRGDYPRDTVTIRNNWLRPSSFNLINDKDDRAHLKKKFPDGAKVILVNDDFADCENESLDDCWTLTQNPLSDYLHHDPLGSLLISVQDITNDLVSLIEQTIEHGIPQTFADPGVVNFNEYSQTEVAPGAIYPATPKGGKALGDAFFQVKTASLSGEVLPFGEKVQELGQLVTGALPSLFGGAAPNSSKTAAQYAMSRAQALQRLQTPWKMLCIWWKEIFGKVIPMFIKEVIDDERYVSQDKSGNFVNVFVRKAELMGKIGSVELEASDQLPATWQQKKDVIMQLMQAGNPLVMEALSDPRNLDLLKEAIGLTDFEIPGNDDRTKQYEEIQQLLASAPIPGQDGQPSPSVDIDPMIDNNGIHADICKNWAISDAGRLARVENESGYQNVLLHMERHVKIMQAQMQMNAANAASGAQSGQGPQQVKGNDRTGPQNQPIAAPMKRSGNEQSRVN